MLVPVPDLEVLEEGCEAIARKWEGHILRAEETLKTVIYNSDQDRLLASRYSPLLCRDLQACLLYC